MSEVAEVGKCSDAKGEFLRNSVGDNWDDVTLDVAMIPAHDLLQRRDACFEVPKADEGLQQREPEIDLCISNSADAPLCVVVPKLFVPMVKGLRGKKLARFRDCTIRQGPVSPERKVHSIQSETVPGFLKV